MVLPSAVIGYDFLGVFFVFLLILFASFLHLFFSSVEAPGHLSDTGVIAQDITPNVFIVQLYLYFFHLRFHYLLKAGRYRNGSVQVRFSDSVIIQQLDNH